MTVQQKEDVKRNLSNQLMLIENATECAMHLCESGIINISSIESAANIIVSHMKVTCHKWQKPAWQKLLPPTQLPCNP